MRRPASRFLEKSSWFRSSSRGTARQQFAFGALCSEGHPIASVTVRRARQHPPDFGLSSSFVETVDLPEIEELSRRLLAAMQITGLVEVEFKQDPRDGRYKVLDVNPRVWGWHTVGRGAGVDFPYLTWRLTQGDTVPETRGRPGVPLDQDGDRYSGSRPPNPEWTAFGGGLPSVAEMAT